MLRIQCKNLFMSETNTPIENETNLGVHCFWDSAKKKWSQGLVQGDQSAGDRLVGQRRKSGEAIEDATAEGDHIADREQALWEPSHRAGNHG